MSAEFGPYVEGKARERGKEEAEELKQTSETEMVAFDCLLNIRQLRGVQFSGFDEDDHMNIVRAVGNQSLKENLKSRLSRVVQLTGFSDPVYAEACVTVHQFDILLDFLIINNTAKTLQDLTLELHTSGDLKLVEKPSSVTLAPQSQSKIAASIKVSSTENGVIFGNICYRSTGATSDSHIVVMNCIHMDIVDYVDAHECTQERFRAMWTEFEWENKVPVKTDICDLQRYVRHICSITNMQLLTPIDVGGSGSGSGSNFLAANLHAKSIFGEHALMNVSIELKEDMLTSADTHDDEKEPPKKFIVCGHIRIRCKSQGIALSLGEKITNKQRNETNRDRNK